VALSRNLAPAFQASRAVTNTKLGDDLDRRTIVIFVAALLSLWFGRFGIRYIPDTSTRLAELCWWSGTQIVSYLIVPLIVVWLVGWKPSDIGWKLRGTSRHWKYYVTLLAIAIPFVVIASTTGEFQERYPLLEIGRGQTDAWADLRIWWIFYVLQFVAVETFFRGFLVLGLAKRFGQMSILIATIPYLMIHFTKPPVEALAAIVGGIVMGFLAYRTKSVWWGVALHVAVAALMDFLSLGHKGFIW
jgi:membrane protease YdiL (CAAX protease family)